MNDPVGLLKNKINLSRLAPLVSFQTRDGQTLSYRYYPSKSANMLIFFHGVGGDSRYLGAIAAMISSLGLAQVVTPDLRGHGPQPHSSCAPELRSLQLVQDFEELDIHLRHSHGIQQLFLAGHSLGGGLVLRIASYSHLLNLQKLFLFSPFLGVNIHVGTKDFGGWIHSPTSQADESQIWTINYPENLKTGTEVLQYPLNYINAATELSKNELIEISKRIPIHLFRSSSDAVVKFEAYSELFEQGIQWKMHDLDSESHLGMLISKTALNSIYNILSHEIY